MLKYLILCLIAVIVFPLLIFFVNRKKVRKWVTVATIYGFLIAVVGLIMQDRFEPLIVVLVLFGLTIVLSVLLDKQAERVEQTAVERSFVEKASSVNTDLPRGAVNKEEAATLDEGDGFTIKLIEDDLNRWIAADRKETDGRRRVDGE